MSAAAAASEIGPRLQSVLQRIDSVYSAMSLSRKTSSLSPLTPQPPPRLVAVSKTKPIADIVEAYRAGQRYFGENYVQELLEKSQSTELQRACPELKWHFIGHCQSGNARKLAQVANLDAVETLDSEKLATLLHKEWTKTQANRRLRVFIQVNTSSEEQKHGCQPGEATTQLAQHVVQSCPLFHLGGLMTIGSVETSVGATAAASGGPDAGGVGGNPDFERLIRCRAEVAAALGLASETQLELSMGMSADYELAIRMGSTNVRVGSTIFGSRNYTN